MLARFAMLVRERMTHPVTVASAHEGGPAIATRVRERMTRSPLTVTPNDSVRKARILMREGRVQRLPVVDRDRLVGIITLGDIWRRSPSGAVLLDDGEADKLLDHVLVGGVMTLGPKVTTPDTLLIDAARLMLERKIGALPVVDHGQLVGIISESDVLHGLID